MKVQRFFERFFALAAVAMGVIGMISIVKGAYLPGLFGCAISGVLLIAVQK